MTVTLAEANELLAARDQAGIKLAAAPGYELFPTTEQMRQIVSYGVLGQVYVAYGYTLGFGHLREAIRSGTGVLSEIDPSWYYRPGGGPLPDAAIYSLQLMTSILGPVRRVTALSNRMARERSWRGRPIPVTINDNTMVLIEFDSGTLGVVAASDCRRSSRIPWGGLGLYGTEGVLEILDVQAGSGYPTRFEVQGGAWGEPAGSTPPAREFSAQLADQPYLRGEHVALDEPHVYADIMDLVDAILEDRSPRSSGEQGRHVVEIIEKAHRAAETGQAQTLETKF
jgi:predicted dehydrogenase